MSQFYESGRLFAFRDAKQGYHSNADHKMAYEAWANATPGMRETQWHLYCDIRDGYAIGTNSAIAQRLKQQGGLSNEPRYIAGLK